MGVRTRTHTHRQNGIAVPHIHGCVCETPEIPFLKYRGNIIILYFKKKKLHRRWEKFPVFVFYLSYITWTVLHVRTFSCVYCQCWYYFPTRINEFTLKSNILINILGIRYLRLAVLWISHNTSFLFTIQHSLLITVFSTAFLLIKLINIGKFIWLPLPRELHMVPYADCMICV